jgi:iron complex transport system substrate-binding protein
VYVLGVSTQLVGRSSACDFPPEAASVPIVGGFGRPSLEAVVACKPDVVFFTDVEKPGLFAALGAAGVRAVRLPCESWEDIERAAHTIAAEAGHPERAVAWVASSRARRKALQQKVERRMPAQAAPRVYLEVWGDPLTTVGAGSYLTDVIARAGGTNICAVLPGAYPHVSPEWVTSQRPECIVLAYMRGGAAVAESLPRRPGWESLPAVVHGHILHQMDPDLLLRPGPRLLEGMEQLADYLMNLSTERDLPGKMTSDDVPDR